MHCGRRTVVIEIENLKKNYGPVPVLQDISTTIQKGEIHGLVGSSGAGKSTLLRCINGLNSYQSGSLKVNGQEINNLTAKELRELRKDIGMIFQDFSLVQRINVYDNIALPMRSWGYAEKEIEKRIEELLDTVQLTGKEKALPRELSGGQQQRVSIARAIAMKPNILLSDEATSALDPNTSKNILKLLQDINQEFGITIVLVSHQMEVVKQICDKISILENGRIKNSGSVSEIFMEHPASLDKLLGEEELKLPQTGHNIKLQFNAESDEAEILSRLASENQVIYRYVSGSIENFKSSHLGIITINLSDEADLQKSIQFFEQEKITYQVVS